MKIKLPSLLALSTVLLAHCRSANKVAHPVDQVAKTGLDAIVDAFTSPIVIIVTLAVVSIAASYFNANKDYLEDYHPTWYKVIIIVFILIGIFFIYILIELLNLPKEELKKISQ